MKSLQKVFYLFLVVLLLSSYSRGAINAQSNHSSKVTVETMKDTDKALITLTLVEDQYSTPLEKENIDLGKHLEITGFTKKDNGIYLIEVKGMNKLGGDTIHLKLSKTDTATNPFGEIPASSPSAGNKPKDSTPTTESTVFTIGQKEYTTTINGRETQKTFDIAPRLHKGRTLLPARAIAEILGLTVSYDGKTRTASFFYAKSKQVKLQLGNKYILAGDEKLPLTGEPLIIEGRILLPLRDIQIAFGKLGIKTEITWNQETQSIVIER